MPDLDLLDLLSADHRNLADAGSGTLVSAVAEHLGLERTLLHPAILTYVDDGGRVVDALRKTDRVLEEALVGLEHGANLDGDHSAMSALRAHIASQEGLFPKIREEIPAEALRDLAEQVPWVVGEAPTHPHPHLPDHGPLREIAAELAGVADHLRDKL